MAENPDDNSSYLQRTVVLRDWWLIKCSKEFEGKRFGVAGTQISETGAVRVFTSSPIIKAFDVFTLQASDGVCILLLGFLNKPRLLLSGFLPQVSREFIFGFPPCWESKCNLCFVGLPSQPPLIHKASRTILSPCQWNLEEDSPALVDKNTEEIHDKPARQKSLRLQSKTVELSKVKNKTSSDGSEGLSKAKSGECEVISNQVISPADGCGKKHTSADNVDKVTSMSGCGESLTSEQGKGGCSHSLFEDFEKSGKKAVSKKSGKILRSDVGNVVVEHGTKVKRKLDVSEVQKNPTTNDVGHGREGLNKAKGNVVERNECMDNEEISPVDGCGKMHSGASSKKITSKYATKASLTSGQRKGKLKVTKTSLHSLSKEVSNSSKPGKNGKSKKSEKILKGDLDVVEPTTHSGSKVIGNLSLGKTIRKIDFDEEVTPDKDAKKQKINPVSPDSLGQRRSRSGRLLVSSLEYWRNQVPVYDVDRNLIQVNEGHKTNSTLPKGRGSNSRKPRR